MSALLLALWLGAPRVYFTPPVPMKDKALNKGLSCEFMRLCVFRMEDCHCDSDGDCVDLSCQDQMTERYCFCAVPEKATPVVQP